MATLPSSIHILYTGGTIGMGPRDPGKPGSPLTPQSFGDLQRYVPGLAADPRIRLTFESFERPIDSSSLGPAHWVEIARVIERAYAAHDGFVILHGTDTLAYTASALAFLLENLAKPVVVTGSQLPISDVRTDAVQNLVNAVQVAAGPAFGLPLIPEVVVVFADRILRGCRVRKVSTTSWAGFDSPNYPPLGTIGDRIRIDPRLVRPVPGEQPGSLAALHVHTRLDTRVLDIGLTPGLQPGHLESILLGEAGIEAVLLRTFGAGNAPDDPEFLGVIEKVTRSKKVVLNVTQCLEGMVEMGLYASSAGLLERGVISALDQTPEAALTKLMWTLGVAHGNRDDVARRMQLNQRGEQSFNLFDLRFGACAEPVRRFAGHAALDPQFEPGRLSRAVVRLAGLAPTEASSLAVFLSGPAGDPVHVADIALSGHPANLAVQLDQFKVRSALNANNGSRSLTMTVATPGSEEEARLSFRGLFLALITRA